MRDFGPEEMQRRRFILKVIADIFEKYGFQPLETPAMENLSVLTGKYGEEGDQLLYRVLNSGDFLHKKGALILSADELEEGEKVVGPKIAEKGLRYDLTVPFARYVAGHFHDLPIPFKRYQIQPVWRADRPQKGRYREFYQCDADVVGTDSLTCEAEILLMIQEVFQKLGIKDYSILLNNRKLLDQIANHIGASDKVAFFTILDKLDKIGKEGVLDEFRHAGFSNEQLLHIEELTGIQGSNEELIEQCGRFLSSDLNSEGLEQLRKVLEIQKQLGGNTALVKIMPTLARGLGYYTGTILEVKVHHVGIGSVSGGGRYDDLTGVFGLPNVSGVGFSFGVDRLYDVMKELGCFPESVGKSTDVLITHFDVDGYKKGLELLAFLRARDIKAEIFPDISKLKKQLQYANKKYIPFAVIIGDEELKTGKYQLRNMESGEQEIRDMHAIAERFINEQ